MTYLRDPALALAVLAVTALALGAAGPLFVGDGSADRTPGPDRDRTVGPTSPATRAAGAARTAELEEPAVANAYLVRRASADPSPSCYDIWLDEVLDRDLATSRTAFEQAARDSSQPRSDRAFAWGRLADRAAQRADQEAEAVALEAIDRLLGAVSSARARNEPPVDAHARVLAQPNSAGRETALAASRAALAEEFDAESLAGRSHAATVAAALAERRQLDLQRLRAEIESARRSGNRAAERRARVEYLGLVVSRAGGDVRAAFRAQRIRLLELLASGRIDDVETLWSRFGARQRENYTQFAGADHEDLAAAIERLRRRGARADLSRRESRATVALVERLTSQLAAGAEAEVARALALIPLFER